MFGRPLLILPLLALLLAGCAAKRLSYRLVSADNGHVLVPPRVAGPKLTKAKLTVDIAAGRRACPPAEGVLHTTVRGNRLRIEVAPDALGAKPQGWLWNWTAEAERHECIQPGEALRLVSGIVEAVPLDPRAADRQLRAARSISFMDIGPDSRLQVVTPILRDGAAPDAPIVEATAVSGNGAAIDIDMKAANSLLGYETAWYGVAPKPDGIGFTLVPLSAERVIDGKSAPSPAPIAGYLRFPAESNFYRLFLKADVEGTSITQMIITAPSLAELERRTREIDADPSLCRATDGLCVAVPRRAAVNVWTAVRVNGREIRVRGGTVRTALEAAGEKNAAGLAPRLRVERPFGGQLSPVEFDRKRADILELPLRGGERISWE